MRYPPEHREQTRQRIIDVASQRLRKEGIANVGVASVMADAGLTHGGFYAHFKSKDDLVCAAIGHAGDVTLHRLKEAVDSEATPEENLEAILGDYLSILHRDMAEKGCVAAAFGSDASRLREDCGEVFTKVLRDRVQFLSEILVDQDDARDKAVAIFSMMVGAMVLSRGVRDERLSHRILRAGKKFAMRLARDGRGSKVSRQVRR